MDMLFGDSTTVLTTPQTRAETGSLMGASSPVPSMDLRGRQMPPGVGPANAIPGFDIDPPHVSIKDGKPQYSADEENGEGVGGWISRMVKRGKGDNGSVKGGDYRRVGQDTD